MRRWSGPAPAGEDRSLRPPTDEEKLIVTEGDSSRVPAHRGNARPSMCLKTRSSVSSSARQVAQSAATSFASCCAAVLGPTARHPTLFDRKKRCLYPKKSAVS